MGIVQRHGGNISVYSELGIGTKFALYLPAQKGNAKNAENADRPSCPDLPVGNGELILLVDDEVSILNVAKESLEVHGYRVLTAVGGEAAIALFDQHQHVIDAVVVDMMMPKLDGMETIKTLRSIRSNIPIVASSGLRRPEQGTGSIAGSNGFLLKPYTDEQLLHAIRDVMRLRCDAGMSSIRKADS